MRVEPHPMLAYDRQHIRFTVATRHDQAIHLGTFVALTCQDIVLALIDCGMNVAMSITDPVPFFDLSDGIVGQSELLKVASFV